MEELKPLLEDSYGVFGVLKGAITGNSICGDLKSDVFEKYYGDITMRDLRHKGKYLMISVLDLIT